MKLLSILGKVGAAALAFGGLVLAGKTGFGKDLVTGNDPADQGEPAEVPTTGEFTTEESSAPAEEAVVEDTTSADSSETE